MSEPTFALVLPASLEELGRAREWFAVHARAAGFEGMDVLDLELVVTEALSNVVRHAYGGEGGHEVRLESEQRGDALVLRICDQGGPFVFPAVENGGEGGYGLGLIEELVDSIQRSHGAEGNTLELVKRRPGGST